ncbi:MAG: nucleotidyltransferase family protein [Patescibacteria group bacterium]
MLPTVIQQHQQNLTQIAKTNNISYMALYGSYSRGDQKQGSDIDLLVSFDKTPGLIEFVGLEQKLSDILGVKVDLVTKQGLSKYVKPYIQDDLEVIYAKKS